MARITVTRHRKIKIRITMPEADARALADSLWEARHLPGINVSPESGFGWLTRIENALITALSGPASNHPRGPS